MQPIRMDKAQQAKSAMTEDELHLRDYLAILQRFRWSAISCFFFVVFCAVVFTLATPPRYTGSCKVAISKSDATVQVENPVNLLSGLDSFFETQLEILKSTPVFEEVVRKLKLQDQPIIHSHPLIAWIKGTIRQAMWKEEKPISFQQRVQQLQQLVTIRPVRDSDVVNISVQAGDPEQASQIANTVAEVFSEISLQFKRSKSSNDQVYLAKKLESTKGDLIDAEKELRSFEDEKDTISLEKRIDYLTNLRIESEGNLSVVERQIKEVEAKLKPLLEQLSTARRGVAQATTEAYAGLQKRLLELNLKQTQLLKKYTAQHPDVRSVQEEIQVVSSKVKSAEKALLQGDSGSVAGMDNVVRQYNETLQSLEVQRAREASLKELVRHYQEQLKSDLSLKSHYDFLSREVEANKTIYDLLLIRHKEASLKADMQISDVRIIEPSIPPEAPSSPRLLVNLILGLILGFGAGIFLAFFRGYMDRTVHPGVRMEDKLGVPCLAAVPRVRELEGKRQKIDLTGGDLADPITLLSLSAELGTPDDPAAVYLVTSAEPGEGKSTVASHLAVSFAQGGEDTIILDCDLRKPRQGGIFGLTDLEITVRKIVADGFPEKVPPLKELPNLTVVPAGDPSEGSPVRVLNQTSFAQTLMALRRRYKRVVIDSPPVNIVADSLHLAQLVDRVVLVIRSEKSKIPSVERAAKSIQEVRGRLAGFVFNGIASAFGGAYYGYGYGYGYGYRSYREYQEYRNPPSRKAS